jgi:hypothetical protein
MEFENLSESGNFELKTRKYTSKKFSRPKKLGTLEFRFALKIHNFKLMDWRNFGQNTLKKHFIP